MRGYHIYWKTWQPTEGDEFVVKHGRNNEHNKYAMAVIDVGDDKKMTVGHLPREIAKICCHVVRHGGTITGVVTGSGEELKKTVEDWRYPAK